MKEKFLLWGPLAAAVAVFIWGAIFYMLLPFGEAGMHTFTDEQAVLNVIQANAPQNGVYVSTKGVFAAIAMTPDLADRTDALGKILIIEFLTEVLTALLLAMVLLQVRISSVLGRAGFAVLIILIGSITTLIPEWNWWGLSTVYTAVQFLDVIMGWFLGGLVLSALMAKMKLA